MSALVKQVTRYRVCVVAEVVATVEGELSFTDQDVRDWADLDGNDTPDPELIQEYAQELIGEEGDLEVKDVTEWKRTEVDIVWAAKEMSAPPEFVPLPGMEGDLTDT